MVLHNSFTNQDNINFSEPFNKLSPSLISTIKMSLETPTVLLIGATGRTGIQVIRAAAVHPARPRIHAFARTPAKLSSEDTALCASVQQGDACNSKDVARALSASEADVVLMAIGIPMSTARSDVRHKSAKALMDVIQPGSEFEHVKILCLSSTGAGGTIIDLGMGVGKILGFVLRHVMEDHDNQEAEFKNRLKDQKSRLLIVRPTGLVEGKATGKTQLFEPMARAPSGKIDRSDLAHWMVSELCGGMTHFGQEVSITGKK